jgi:long-subunit fatty acid transport protein
MVQLDSGVELRGLAIQGGRMLTRRIGLVLVAGAALTVSSAGAQTTADINSGLQLNFTPPGAKSLGLGGAFSGVADDATAVYANPAGLTSLSRPEASLEGRSSRYTNVFPSGGGEREISSTTNALAFGSVVFPVQDFSFAAYYHNAADFHPRFDAVEFNTANNTFVPRRIGSLDLELKSAGVAAAYRVTESLSLGLAVTNFQYKVSSCTQVNAESTANCVATPGDFSSTQEFHGKESRWGGTAGLKWETGDWSAGLVYRKLPEFKVTTRYVDSNAVAGGAHSVHLLPGRFKVPDVLSAGAGFHPLPSLLVSFEYDRVWYSQLAEDLVKMAASSRANYNNKNSDPSNFSISDGNEFHLGAEYRLSIAAERALLFRLGAWREADHTLRYNGTDDALAARFGTGKDREDPVHGAGGLGLVLGKRFQIDAGVDYSSRLTSFALSSVARF